MRKQCIAACLSLGLLPLTLAAAGVTLTDNGTTVTLANGVVSATFTKADGTLTSVVSNALPSTNLVDSSGIGLQLTHIGAGPETAAIDDYWTNISGGGGATYSVITNTAQMVDIQIRNPKATGDITKYPNGLWDWAVHHVMRAGDSGFYTYHVWRHNATHPQSYFQADSWQGHTSSIFSASPTNLAWQFTEDKVGLSFGLSPAGSNSNGVPGEVVILPQSSYFTHPTGQYYESGWPIYDQPTGPTHDLLPTWTKYDWTQYLGPYTSYRNTWGVANDQVGFWRCNPSHEWRNGGPTKLTGTTSGNYMYTDDIEGHGLGPTNTTVAAGQVFTKFVGPFFTYINTGTDHNALWADAQARGAQEVAAWPYSWVNEPEAEYPRNRGTVTGTIAPTTGQSAANAVVILGDPVSATYPDWFWQGCINYLFWTTADANGNFTIPKVRPGTYTLYSYVPGIFGELIQNNVTVTANGTTSLGSVSWNPPRAQNLLFQVGIPDHSTEEFRFANLTKQFGLWWRYFTEMGTSDLNYTCGLSDPAQNWYYAQMIFALANGTYFAPHWNINFNLPILPADPVTLTVDLAGGRGTAFYTYVNGVNQTPAAQKSTGIYTVSGADIYRDVLQVGQWQHYTVTLPASAFKVGANTLQLQVRQGGAATTWDTTGYWPELLSGGLMYDAIKLESGAATTQLIQNGVYSVLSKQNDLSVFVNGNSNAAGAAVIEWPYQLAGNDQWRFTNLGGDVYSIVEVNSGLALEAAGASTASNGLIDQGTYTGAANQKWQAVLNGAGGLAFINQNSGLALDVPGGRTDYQNTVQLIQNAPNSGVSQSWFVTPPVLSATPANATLTAAPAAPAGLTASGGVTSTNLSWTAAPTAVSYTVLRGTTDGGPYTVLAASVTSTTYTDIWLANGAPYYYVVTATNAVGISANSNQAKATTDADAPTGVAASAGNTQIGLAWNSAASATGYVVRRATVSGGPYTTVASAVGGTIYTDNGLANGTPYYYVVAAANGSGTGVNSVEVTATPTASVPLAPTGLSAAAGNAQVALNWSAVAGSTYNVLRSTTSGNGYATVASSLAATTYTDTGVVNGSTYYYVVTATNAGGSSIRSNQASAAPVAPPAAPSGLTALPGNATAALTWAAVPYAASYTLLRGTTSGSYPTTLATNLAGTSYGDSGLANGITYYYVVKAVNISGTSGSSNQASVTPTGSVPATPSGLVAQASGNSQITLSWGSAAGAASYLVRRGTASGSYATPVTISAASPSYVDTSVTNGATYYYVVAASNVNGVSGNSNEANATAQAVLPSAPTGLAATGGNRQVTLTWSAGANAATYMVKRGTASDSETTTVVSGLTGTSYTDPGLTNGTAYYYVVASANSTGASGNSSEASATPSRPTGTVIWQGTAGTNWDTSSLDWMYGSVPVNYQSGDSPTFDDNGAAGSTSITLNASVSPTSVTVSGNNLSYTFLGNYGITGNGSLSFLGSGNTLTLVMPNSYTGQTLIQNGTLILQSPGSLGATKIVFDNGALNSTYASTASISLGAATLNVPTGNTGTVNLSSRMSIGPLTGGGTMNLNVPGGSIKYENLYGGWGGNFTGILNVTGTVSTALVTAYYNGGSPDFDGNLGNATVNLNNVALASWDGSGGNTFTAGALNGTATANIVGSAYAGGLTLSVGALNTNSNFAGVIANTAGGGATNLTKVGTGALTLSGSNPYTGATKVTVGSLVVNGAISASAVTVSAGATLGGSGTLGGAVSLASGAGLLFTPGSPLNITGSLSFGSTVPVTLTMASVAPGTYRLLNYSGSYTGSPTFSYTPPLGGGSATFDTSVAGQINVTIAAPTFAQWAAGAFPGQSNPAIIGMTADPDHDGYPNLLEYFFGTNPSAANVANPVSGTLDGAGNLLFDFAMSKSLSGVSYSIQQSAALGSGATWADTGIRGAVLSDQGTYWIMQATIPLNGQTNSFFRLRVTVP